MVFIPKIADGKFLIVDKPNNVITHELTASVGRLFSLKSGHAGTLDPDVSGVLPIALGRATKLLRFLSFADKEYVALFHLPWAEHLDEKSVERRLRRFEGVITQTPPKMSAVAKKPRKRRIYYIKMLEKERSFILLKAKVERGTYMRVLAEQMGGKMISLRRIAVGFIREEDCSLIQRVQESVWFFPVSSFCFKDPEWVLERVGLGKVFLKKGAVEPFLHGSPIFLKGVESFFKGKNNYYSVFSDSEFLGVAEKRGNTFFPVRVHKSYG